MANNMESVGWRSGGLTPAPVATPPRSEAPRGTYVPVAAPPAGDPTMAAATVNQHLASQTELKLQVDVGSGRTVFQVVQQSTGAVVLQVPSEEVLGMSRRVRELESQPGAPGALVDREG